MLVIVIIGIMLSITLSISWSQTKLLRFKIARENFIANYNAFIIKAITTNSTETELIFQQLEGPWWVPQDPIVLSGAWAANIYFENMSQIWITSIGTTLTGLQWLPENHILSFDPIQWNCVMSIVSWPISSPRIFISMWYRDDTTIPSFCYEISLSTCKIRQIPWCSTNPQ